MNSTKKSIFRIFIELCNISNQSTHPRDNNLRGIPNKWLLLLRLLPCSFDDFFVRVQFIPANILMAVFARFQMARWAHWYLAFVAIFLGQWSCCANPLTNKAISVLSIAASTSILEPFGFDLLLVVPCDFGFRLEFHRAMTSEGSSYRTLCHRSAGSILRRRFPGGARCCRSCTYHTVEATVVVHFFGQVLVKIFPWAHHWASIMDKLP